MSNLPSPRPRQDIGETSEGKRVTLVGGFARWLDQLRARVDSINRATSPTGAIISTLATTEPVAWLFCNGQAVSKKSYPDLFLVVGTTYGSTETTFNLPDLTNRFLVGAGTIANKSTGGSSSITLSEANLPAHNHPVTDPQHTHTFTGAAHSHTVTDPGHTHTGGVAAGTSAGTSGSTAFDLVNTGSSTTGISVDSATAGGTNAAAATGVTVGNTGGGAAFDNTPPALGVGWLIKT